MQLRISNVGKIERAVIDIDGITVIAGENNAGKSTIGKLIFAVFNSLNGMDDKVEAEKKTESTISSEQQCRREYFWTVNLP